MAFLYRQDLASIIATSIQTALSISYLTIITIVILTIITSVWGFHILCTCLLLSLNIPWLMNINSFPLSPSCTPDHYPFRAYSSGTCQRAYNGPSVCLLSDSSVTNQMTWRKRRSWPVIAQVYVRSFSATKQPWLLKFHLLSNRYIF